MGGKKMGGKKKDVAHRQPIQTGAVLRYLPLNMYEYIHTIHTTVHMSGS